MKKDEDREIEFRAQAAAIGVEGLMETFDLLEAPLLGVNFIPAWNVITDKDAT